MKERVKKIFKFIIKIRYFLVFAILLLSVNAYAWFVYISKVDTSFSARVRSWNVMFQVHDSNISEHVYFNVGDIYPGMTAYHDSASIINTGETSGEIYFEIKRVEIFGTVYTSDNYTNAQLLSLLANDYPFSINLSLSDTIVSPNETEVFSLDITWPYESGNDALDTYWGTVAYNYLNNSQSTTCIAIMADVKVDQESVS